MELIEPFCDSPVSIEGDISLSDIDLHRINFKKPVLTQPVLTQVFPNQSDHESDSIATEDSAEDSMSDNTPS